MVARRLLVLAAVLASLVLSACGNKEPIDELGRHEAVREGLEVELGGLTYNVFITRQLNPQDATDRDYYPGAEPAPDQTLYGVFVQVCNDGDEALPSAEEFTLTDTTGEVFHPTELPEENVFAYRAAEVQPHNCIPRKNSAAANAPIAGAMLLFTLPLATTENRPLELEVVKPAAGPGPADDHIKIELDI